MFTQFSKKTKWSPLNELSQAIERLKNESKNKTKQTLSEIRTIYNSMGRDPDDAFDFYDEEIRPEILRERMICKYQMLSARSFA